MPGWRVAQWLCPQVSVPGPRSHVTLPDLLAATKYRVLVSAVYGAGESVAVTATGCTGEWARNLGPRAAPSAQNCGAAPGASPGRWAVATTAEGNRVFAGRLLRCRAELRLVGWPLIHKAQSGDRVLARICPEVRPAIRPQGRSQTGGRAGTQAVADGRRGTSSWTRCSVPGPALQARPTGGPPSAGAVDRPAWSLSFPVSSMAPLVWLDCLSGRGLTAQWTAAALSAVTPQNAPSAWRWTAPAPPGRRAPRGACPHTRRLPGPVTGASGVADAVVGAPWGVLPSGWKYPVPPLPEARDMPTMGLRGGGQPLPGPRPIDPDSLLPLSSLPSPPPRWLPCRWVLP